VNKLIYIIILLCIITIIVSIITFYQVKEVNLNYSPIINQKPIEVEIYENEKLNYGTFTVTAYSPSDNISGICADENPEVTAIGAKAEVGVIAVNPNVIPYESNVAVILEDKVIKGKALDTGGAMRQNPKKIDILMNNYEEAKDFGVQEGLVIWW